MIVVPTIPHTGTHFVIEEILRDVSDKKLMHLFPQSMDEIRSLSNHPWIVPLRHPYSVAETWKGRLKSLPELVGFWYRLVDEIAPFEPLYLAIDNHDREQQLARLNGALDMQVKTTWPVVASHGLRKPLEDSEKTMFDQFVPFYENAGTATRRS